MAKKRPPAAATTYHMPPLAWLAGILVFTCLLYLKSLPGQFLNYDDTVNVADNALIRQLTPDHIRQLFLQASLYMYAPLTFISYGIDHYLFGPDPFFFKLTNLVLHLVNISLLFFLSLRLFRKTMPAAFLALLFAIHPMNVDTVSWISARSNLLSALFYLLALLFYLNYLKEKKTGWLVMVALSFILSLLSKSAAIMLPATLFVIDYLNNRKITLRGIMEKLPLFITGALFGIAAIYFRSDAGNPQSLMEYNTVDRILMVSYSLVGYLFNTILPFHLSAIYAYPLKSGSFLPIAYYLSPLLLAGLIFLLFRLKVLKREFVSGLLFFLINIMITQVVLLEDGFMANRYGYLPCIGLIFIMAAAFDYLIAGSGIRKNTSVILLAILILFFSVSTWQRSQVWKNTLVLFSDVVEKSPGSAFALNNRGIARYAENDMDGALSDYTMAITIFPRYSGAYYNRGIVYYGMKDFGRAEQDYSTAIELNPGFSSCFMARGILEMDVMRNDTLAMSDYNRAIMLNPGMAQAYYNRGILRLRMKEVGQACEDFHRVRSLGYSRADDLIRQFCE